MKEQLIKIDRVLTQMRYSGYEYDTTEKDTMLLSYLSMNDNFLTMERLYGKEFTKEFYRWYLEPMFL